MLRKSLCVSFMNIYAYFYRTYTQESDDWVIMYVYVQFEQTLPNSYSQYLHKFTFPPSIDKRSSSSTASPFLEVQLHGEEWVERHNAGEIDSKGCCKILRKDATAVGYLFIHSSNNYLMKICYIAGTVLGSGNTAVKGWRECLSSWGLQSIGKRSIRCQSCTTCTKPLFSDFHPNSGVQMHFLQVLSNFFLATVFRAPANLTGFPGGVLTTWTSRCIQIPELQCSSWRSIDVWSGSLQLDNSGFLVYHLNLSCCKR